MNHSETMASLGIALPEVAAPVGSYVPAIQSGSLVVTSGQLPMAHGQLVCVGKVGADCTLQQAAEAAGVAAINALAAAASAVGGVDRIERIIRVGVFVNSAPGFTDQPKVANGASELLVRIFGDAGRHARAAVGVSELPLNAAVEVELTVRAAS